MTVTNKERGVSFFDAEGNPSPLPRGWCLGCGTQPSLRLRGFPGKDRRRSTGENGVSQYAGSKGWRSRCEVLDLSSHFGSDPDACPKMRVDDPRVLGDSRLLSLEGNSTSLATQAPGLRPKVMRKVDERKTILTSRRGF